MQPVLAQYFGFEYSVAVKVFMVGFAALGLLAALLVRLTLTQWIMAAALFATSLSAPTNQKQTEYLQTWMLPVQVRRAEIHLTLGILLSVLVMLSGKLHIHFMPVQGLFILAITMYAGFLQFFHEGAKEGMESIGFGLAVVPCMLFAAPAACRNFDSCMKVLRSMMVVSAVWAVCSSIQFVINPRLVLNGEGGRFWGMMSNAQGAAMFCAPMAILGLWLMMHDDKKRLKPLWIAMLAINLLFVGWTASRTGLVMLMLGGASILYNRIGKFILFLPVSAAVVVALSFLSDELQIQSNLDRITNFENTRGGVWSAQMAAIADSPLIGVGWKETGGSESSWLGGFAGYGILMFVIMVSFLIYSMAKCANLWIRRRRMPREQRPLIDMFIAWNAMYFGAATFEGILLGRSSTSQMFTLMFAGIGVWLAEEVSAPRDLAYEELVEGEEEAPVDIVDDHAADQYGFDPTSEGYPPDHTA